MDSKWVSLIDNLGLPVFLLLMVGLFCWKALWPMIKGQIEAGNEERRRISDRMNDLLDRNIEVNAQVAERLRQMNEGIDGLRRDFNNRK